MSNENFEYIKKSLYTIDTKLTMQSLFTQLLTLLYSNIPKLKLYTPRLMLSLRC